MRTVTSPLLPIDYRTVTNTFSPEGQWKNPCKIALFGMATIGPLGVGILALSRYVWTSIKPNSTPLTAEIFQSSLNVSQSFSQDPVTMGLSEISFPTCLEEGFSLSFHSKFQPPKSVDPSLETIDAVSSKKFCNYMTKLIRNYRKTAEHPPRFTWYSHIPLGKNYEGARLYLGALPVFDDKPVPEDIFSRILSENVSSVLSMVEPFERTDRSSTNRPVIHSYRNELPPVTSRMWEEKGIHQLILPTPDDYPVSFLNIQTAAWFIHEELSHGRSIYVHCKSGEGRSATVVFSFLMEYLKLPADQVFELLVTVRPNISKHKPKEQSIRYLEWLKSRDTTTERKVEDLELLALS